MKIDKNTNTHKLLMEILKQDKNVEYDKILFIARYNETYYPYEKIPEDTFQLHGDYSDAMPMYRTISAVELLEYIINNKLSVK